MDFERKLVKGLDAVRKGDDPTAVGNYLMGEYEASLLQAKREVLERLPFKHPSNGWCELTDVKYKPCARCAVDAELASLEGGGEHV